MVNQHNHSSNQAFQPPHATVGRVLHQPVGQPVERQSLSVTTKFHNGISNFQASPLGEGDPGQGRMQEKPGLPSFPSDSTLFEIDLECGTNPPTPLTPMSDPNVSKLGLVSKVRRMTSGVFQTTLKQTGNLAASISDSGDVGKATRNNTMTPFDKEEHAKEIAAMVHAQFL